MPSKATASRSGGNDGRFTRLSSDPRYRLPSAKGARVGVDKRFSRMFKDGDQDFNRRAQVDKYGRKIDEKAQSKQDKNLQNLYREHDDEDDEDEEELEDENTGPKKGQKSRRTLEIGSASDDEDEDSGDDDSDVAAELRRVDKKYDPARDGGFSSSDSDSSDEESEVEDAELPEETEAAKVPMGEPSRRIAIVNLDWDNIRAADIFAVAASFVPSGGRIESCAIYPSEFGKERLEREELEGPPKEIFAPSKAKSTIPKAEDQEDDSQDESEEDETIQKRLQKGDDGEEFDSAALRRYQLDRLRYFYAVLSCSSASVAQGIYSELDGKEYMTSANFFDLRFIPDEVSFDGDKPREIITKLPAGSHKPNEFVTEALTHSKVKLTWDADDASRKEVQKRAFSRKEIDDNDLRAYIGGSSDSESDIDEGDVDDVGNEAAKPKQSKKEAERQRMRALLGLNTEEKRDKKSSDRPVGDMQVTFTSGLSGGGRDGSAGRGGVFENSPPRDETTRERYVRKEKERKARRREKAKAKRDGAEGDDADSGSDIGVEAAVPAATADPEADPFDDPFFNDAGAPDASKSKKEKQRKVDRIAKREAKRAAEEKSAVEREQLEKLMDDGTGATDKMKHFDMKAIAKAAKNKGKNKKNKKSDAEEQEGVAAPEPVETSDPRFASRLYGSHEFAIDPTNPRFVKTEAMQQFLEEGRKRRRDVIDAEEQEATVVKKTKGSSGGGAGDDTQKLLAKVKARSKAGKR